MSYTASILSQKNGNINSIKEIKTIIDNKNIIEENFYYNISNIYGSTIFIEFDIATYLKIINSKKFVIQFLTDKNNKITSVFNLENTTKINFIINKDCPVDH